MHAGGKARATELAARKPASNGTNGRAAAEAGAGADEGGQGPSEGTPGARLEGLKGAGRGRARGMVLPFQPLALTFRHVNYYVPMPTVRCHRGGDALTKTVSIFNMLGLPPMSLELSCLEEHFCVSLAGLAMAKCGHLTCGEQPRTPACWLRSTRLTRERC